jgi:hypothetical protein
MNNYIPGFAGPLWNHSASFSAQLSEAVTFWNFLRNVSNAKMWISKFRFEIECIIKM